MNKGKLMGSLPGFYQECKRFHEAHDGAVGSSIGLFIALCERTLGNRRDRDERYREKQRQNELNYRRREIQNLHRIIDELQTAEAA
jgi:hypothetical protein